MKIILFFIAALFPFSACLAQTGAEPASAEQADSPVQARTYGHFKQLPRNIPERKIPRTTLRKLSPTLDISLRKRLNRERARNFFLITLIIAAVLWLAYAGLYFATIDVTSGILLTLAGFCGFLAIPATLFMLIGLGVWIYSLSQGY